MKRALFFAALLVCVTARAGGYRYTNPILHQDWSDPDVCRVGDDYYMTASSFNFFPGLTILHSRDLVNWEIIGSALESYNQANSMKIGHGNYVWAPSIRWHDGWFYIYVGDPDSGIFMVRTQDPSGPWEKPVWVVRGRGLIDPCPLWDDDGRAYLSHALAGSRAGLKSVVLAAPMSPDGTSLLGPSRIIYDGHGTQPTIEGTKFYKRDGWYYLFCPAGGVATGWQTVLRSRSPWGPWEERIVLAWAPGTINGPHQGAWVDTPSGSHWFIHFQDKGAYGRIVHLQPMEWLEDGWPLIGEDPDGDGVGQPVSSWETPFGTPQGNGIPSVVLQPGTLSPEWQFPASPKYPNRIVPAAALEDGGFRLFSMVQTASPGTLWHCSSLIQQKFPAERFTISARLTFRPRAGMGENCGFVVMGNSYAGFRLDDTPEGALLQKIVSLNAATDSTEQAETLCLLPWESVTVTHPYASGNVPPVKYADGRKAEVWVRLEVRPKAVEGNVPDAMCQFFWSVDGKRFTKAGERFKAAPDMWTGARFGFWCRRSVSSNDCGSLDVRDIQIGPEFAPLEGFVYNEAQVPDYQLPDALTTSDGHKVKSVRQWEKKRRPELLALLEKEMYGTAPGRPSDEWFELIESGDAFDGAATRKQVRVHYAKGEYLDLLLYVPKGDDRGSEDVRGSGQAGDRRVPGSDGRRPPVFIGINFFGNHTVCSDPLIALPDSLRWRPGFILGARGSQASRWPVETIVRQGFALATFCCEDVAPDHPVPMRARSAFEGFSWGNIAAWAWGLSRALDYLEADPSVDGGRVVVTGFSRMGKAAVWAGARDRRFAAVVSSASGCGGAALSRRRFGETVRRINTHYPYWFCEAFHKYGGNEDLLPFDQHELLSLIAPRPLYVASGSEDLWSDPRGEFLSLCCAADVYRLYGLDSPREQDLPLEYGPLIPGKGPSLSVREPICKGNCGYHIHPGPHDVNDWDWERYLSFIESVLK